MEVGVMITNGGPHSAETWAENTASHIVKIADSVTGERRGSAIKLQALVIDVITEHHTTVQLGERSKIIEHGVARLQHDMTPDDHVSLDDVISQIIAAAKGTPWEADFQTLEFTEKLKNLLADHFMSSAYIERSWHADRNINTPEAQAFNKQFKE